MTSPQYIFKRDTWLHLVYDDKSLYLKTDEIIGIVPHVPKEEGATDILIRGTRTIVVPFSPDEVFTTIQEIVKKGK